MKKKIITIATAASAFILGLAACGQQGGSSTPTKKFEFTIGLESGRNGVLYYNDPLNPDPEYKADRLIITEKNTEEGKTYSYTPTVTISSSGLKPSDYLTVTYGEDAAKGLKYFTLNVLKETGKDSAGNDIYVSVSVKEASVARSKQLAFRIVNSVTPSDAAYNFVSDASARTEILGKLEEYAMENFLTGISLFENGGWVRYSKRVTPGTTEYITGYGTGLLSEGSLDDSKAPTVDGKNNITSHIDYLQSAQSSDPLTINAWDASGSQVSDLNGYITSSYWGTRKKSNQNTYEWYPVLAKDTYTPAGKTEPESFLRPVHVEKDNDLKLYKKWRIYVKTGEEDGLVYRTASSKYSEFEKTPVSLDDYEFAFQMLLTGNEVNDVSRGIELAADTTYGIKGAQQYYNNTGKIKLSDYDSAKDYNAALDTVWKNMQQKDTLGIHTGKDAVNGSYIEFELVNPIDEFTAMYVLSSNLYSPIPKDFLQKIGGEDYTEGRKLYGTFPNSSTSAADITLSVGPFFLEEWNKNQDISFKRNEEWFEVKNGSRYHIKGVHITKIDTSKNDEAIFERFNNGELDSVGIPKSKMDTAGDGTYLDIKATGDSTFKLNVNSCTQERWNSLFGSNGSIKKGTDDEYKVKPWMSNKNFLKGIFWSIDRKSFAEARGTNPSINYLAGAYLSDPEKSKSYNETEAHAKAIANFHNVNETTGEDDYGYNEQIAVNYFSKAIDELTASGDITIKSDSATDISIRIWWMYQTDIRDYGGEITNYIKTAFEKASKGKITISFEQKAEPLWDQVYSEHLQVGKFDLGFGAISGNTYNPLNFFEVLKSDNSSTFTLNWGVDTGIVDPVNPIIYNGKSWSFDALWAAADHGTISSKGKDVNPVFECYKTQVSDNKLYNGGTFEVPFSFVELEKAESVKLEVTRIRIWLRGAESIDLVEGVHYTYDKSKKRYYFTISSTLGAEINTALFEGNKLQKQIEKPGVDEETKQLLEHPFRDDTYNFYWNIEIYYSMEVAGSGYATENVFNVYANVDEQNAARK